ncbi:MAG: PEPxxWA-CTERM sorting domain-containing protein [Burkholderiales bacterium]|nr:PEPxxWA-CTERM sorting domain-containing protein [Burkholderiales bacterium]
MRHEFNAALLAAGLLSANIAQAALSSNGNGLVYDSVQNITWSSDANLFASMYAGDPALVSKIIAAVPTIANTPNTASPTGIYALSAADFTASLPGAIDWFGAQAFVGYLNSSRYLGQNTWSLPAANPVVASAGQLGSLFTSLGGVVGASITTTHNSSYSLFTNVQDSAYWHATEFATGPSLAWGISSFGFQIPYPKAVNFYTWVMLPGNMVAPVPEPGEWAMMLAGFGLIGVIARRR